MRNPYPNLVVAEATRQLIDSQPVWNIPVMNRMLVERTTHPEALEALTRELEGADRRWRDDLLKMTGQAVGDVQAAAQARLRWDAGWIDDAIVFPEDEYVATRLGARDLIVKLPWPVGPFDEPVRTLSIPKYWLDGIDINKEVEPVVSTAGDGLIRFTIQTAAFDYDCLRWDVGSGAWDRSSWPDAGDHAVGRVRPLIGVDRS